MLAAEQPELTQLQLIEAAITHLNNNLNWEHGDFTQIMKLANSLPLLPPNEYLAWEISRKHWRSLKKTGIVLPKKFENHYELRGITERGCTCLNLSKGTTYTLERIGDEEFSCDCAAYLNGNDCGHVKYARANLALFPEVSVSSAIAPISLPSAGSSTDTEEEILPGIFATAGQSKALKELHDFAHGSKAIHGLYGFAGSGKSLLLQAWIKQLRDRGWDKRVVFTAPTNKAVQVLQNMVSQWHLGIDCITCAKLLGLKPKIDLQTGKEYFEKAYGEDSTIDFYDVVVIDEASMVSGGEGKRKGLWEHLTEEAGLYTKLLFVGDYAQLPPVGEPISQVFLKIQDASQLTEVKRYKGSIGDIATDLRSNLKRKSEPIFTTSCDGNRSEGVFVFTHGDWKTALVKAFSSEKYLADPNFCRAIAYRNERVGQINKVIREAIRGTDAPRFVKGERLIGKEHYSVKSFGYKTVFNTSAEMEVTSIRSGTQQQWDVHYLDVQIMDAEGRRECIPVLASHERERFEKHQKKVKGEAQAGNRAKWREYYELHKQFAWVDYAYCLTAHKSQGSTFTNVFVDVSDILINKTRNLFTWPNGTKELIYERNQLLYVALTRASHRVFVYE